VSSRYDTVVVGGGHNGLVAGCFLAREGREVILLEAAAAVGGGCRTQATVQGHPDVLFDLHSVAHNLINMTDIIEELTRRKVVAFMSASHQDPDLQVELLLLEPEEAGDETDDILSR